jgi:acyl carrier protein
VQSALVQAGVPTCMVADVDWPTACDAYQAQGRRPFLDGMARRVDALPLAASVATAPAATGHADHSTAPGELRATLLLLDARARRERMAALVRVEVARVLRLAGPEAVDPVKGFFELGLDSLMAMQLRRRLADATGIALAATVAFNHPSVWPLADHLLQRLELPVGDEPAAGVPAPITRATVDTLSDDEVRQALQLELAAAGLLDDDTARQPGGAR